MLEKEFIAEMMKQGFERDVVAKALECFDNVLSGYTVTKSVANITVRNVNNVNTRFVDLYLQCKRFDGFAEGTLSNKYIYLKKLAEFLPCSVLDATPIMIRQFLSTFNTKRNGEKAMKSYINKIKQHVSAFYRWLIVERQIAFNPVDSVSQIKVKKEFKGALKPEELSELKYACNNDRERFLIEFLVSSGCRVAEFVSIKWDDVDFNNRCVKVLGKGNKERIVYFSAESKTLAKSDTYYHEEYLFSSVFKNHGKLSTEQVEGILKNIYLRVADKISLKKVTPHTLRRTFATDLLSKGATIDQVSKFLGHESITTTMGYVDIDQSTLKAQHYKFVS